MVDVGAQIQSIDMPELLKISELAARAGVAKSTIQHYIREGLIPKPEKRPHRNMHYYNADLVDRIKLIRDLQTRRNLSLARIKELLADEVNLHEIRVTLSSPAPLELGNKTPVSRSQLIADSGFTGEQLDDLESRGFIESDREDGAIVYGPIDAAIAAACGSMRQAGLNPENGFGLDALQIYLDAMRDLIVKEMILFTKGMAKHPPEKLFEMARSGLAGTNTLLLNLRRKIFLRMLAATDNSGALSTPKK